MTQFDANKISIAVKKIGRADPIMKRVIQQTGSCTLKPRKQYFRTLVGSMISQQISTSAAKSIQKKLLALLEPHPPSAEKILKLTAGQLKSAGISPQKQKYLTDLCEKVHSGELKLRSIAKKEDEEVIAELTQVQGIGVWTAQMFLIFSLGRLDVLPHGDLGVRIALRELYDLDDLPNEEECHEIAKPWRPYATIGSWYCWRALDFIRAKK